MRCLVPQLVPYFLLDQLQCLPLLEVRCFQWDPLQLMPRLRRLLDPCFQWDLLQLMPLLQVQYYRYYQLVQ